MKIIITRGGVSSFVVAKDKCLAINLGKNDDALNVFKWVNMNYKKIMITGTK